MTNTKTNIKMHEDVASSIEEAVLPKEKTMLLDEYYASVVNSAKNTFGVDVTKNDSVRYTCSICQKRLPVELFFKTYSIRDIGRTSSHGERYSHICRSCSKKIFEEYYNKYQDPQTAVEYWCYVMDLYYDEEYYKRAETLTERDRQLNYMVTKFDYLKHYLDGLNKARMIGKSYWESPRIANRVERIVLANLLDDIIGEEALAGFDLPFEFDSWSTEDIENYKLVLALFKYDPFKDEPIDDRKRLYYNLVSLSDETMEDDFAKANAAIDTCRSMQRLEKLNSLRIRLESEDHPDIKEIKELTNLQKAEREAINKYGKEHGFILRYALNKTQGSGTLTGILKDMDTNLFESSLVNRYDIATSEAMQLAANISWKAIFEQLNLSESEFADVIKDLRQMIESLLTKNVKLQEEVRRLQLSMKKKELEQKLIDEKKQGGE